MIGIGIDKTKVTVSTTFPEFRLGSRAYIDDLSNGYQEFVYGRANGAITALGYVCLELTGFDFAMASTTNSAPGTAGPGTRVAVAQAAMADNEYGWFQIYGKGSVRTLASAAIGTRLNTTGTAGCVDDDGGAGAEQIVGMVLMTATGGAQATNADAMLSYPVVSITL